MTEGSRHVPCVGAILHDATGRLLLIKRGTEPARGRWSLPGGHVEPGEDDAAALVREMAEETGLAVEPGPHVGTVLVGPYRIADYRCTLVGGTLAAGDDAADARWVDAAEFAALPLVDGLAETLADWAVLPH
ncbi:NUDIX domain-containing protein [Pseudonocardia kujensis]|uniref:NUDIX hydrolase n=1 Tax=Pseudonocardia kujensis TaxID=1128675 RepID=UPI001E3D371C|nr:NUDIX domain-containing protein [Pseudonocardia kujensis]MCE0767754.1 NUDIX domain-containing protein [Pseudonocardia kujensis]